MSNTGSSAYFAINSGRLEILFQKGKWGTVCGDSFKLVVVMLLWLVASWVLMDTLTMDKWGALGNFAYQYKIVKSLQATSYFYTQYVKK